MDNFRIEKLQESIQETDKMLEQHKQLVEQEIQKIEQQAELEFNKTLNQIENQSTTETLEDIFFIPKQYTKMVINGNARGFLLFGSCGLGKTYSVIRAFGEMKKNFVILSGHITSLELYNFLFEHRQEHIVLDDVNILENEQNLNLLKSCLSDNSRLVQYHTTSSKLRVPNKFIFEGSLIILLNKIPRKNESLKAVESRILTYELKMDYETKIKIIFELAKQNYKEMKEQERLEIVKWIKENTSEATENLNLRLLFTCYEMYRFDKENWIKMAQKLIVNDRYIQLIVQGCGEQDFIQKTGLSRMTYYRFKKKVSKYHDF